MSLCLFDLSKCVAGPDALAPKDRTVGQVACLKVALCSLCSACCLELQSLSSFLCPVQLSLLLGRLLTFLSIRQVDVYRTCLEHGLLRRHLSACSLHLSEAFWLVQGSELGDRHDALPRKLVKRRKIKIKE